jgi:phenylacetate-CoA ligase
MLDVRDKLLGVDGLTPYLHAPDTRRVETLRRQQRVLRRRALDREPLRERMSWPAERLDRWQLDRVRQVVESAFVSHPFYHRLYRKAGFESGDMISWSDYQALPTVTKAELLEHQKDFSSGRALAASDVFTSRTSGSSGLVLDILQDDATSDAGHVFYLRQYETMIGRPRRPEEWLYDIYLGPHRYSSLDGAHPIFTVSQEAPPTLVAEHLRRLRPTILAAFPSYLLRMAKEDLAVADCGIEAIAVHSETSTVRERERISRHFGAPVFDEYSSEELYLIATQCRHGRYHLVEDNVRVDAQSFDGGPPEIVATSLTNTYMPFIRYRQGDAISLNDRPVACPCGTTFRVLDGFVGRIDQLLHRLDGSEVPSDVLMGLYDRTLLGSHSEAAEFQLRQQVDGDVELLVRCRSTGPAPDAGAINAFCSGLLDLLGGPPLQVRHHMVSAFPSTGSHKRRLVISEYRGQRQGA